MNSHGFSANLYKSFEKKLKYPLCKSYHYSFEKGKLPISLRRNMTNLISQKYHRFVKSWRPVSLLNSDSKILKKALANNIPKIVNTDQVGYIRGRQIGENIQIIEDLIKSSQVKKIQGLISLTDF